MNLYSVVPLLLLVAVLQSVLAPRLGVAGAQPDLMLLMVVAWSMRRGLVEGAVWAFCGGMALDLLSGAPLGGAALGLMAAAGLTSLARASLVRSRGALPWVMAALATLIYYAVLMIALGLTGRPLDVGGTMLHAALPAAVYNVAAITVVYSLLTWLDRRTGEPELRW